MTKTNNALTTGAAAALSVTQAQNHETWVACLLLEGAELPDGMTTSRTERLPGAYQTPADAMDAAMAAIELRPDAIGVTAKRVFGGACHGL